MGTFAVLYPTISGLDFRADAILLDVPVYLFQGRHEAPGRAVLAETSGHRSLFEQPAEFHRFLTDVVLLETA